MISPTYTGSPAPMGLGDIGIQDEGGTNVATISYTSSIEGSATLNTVNPLYVTSSAPDEFTMQLNTVLTNVDVLGNVSNTFWIQNVAIYAAGSSTLSFENNIWNFSNPQFFFNPSSIYSGHGFVESDEVYIAGGPSFHVPTPFTVVMYNTAGILNDRPTEYFNYTIIPGGTEISGTFDTVEFNSDATPPTTPAPSPTFQINGEAYNPTGYLLNDAEIMLGGPGGGSTTTLFNIAGSMGLYVQPNGTNIYQPVPAAYDFGDDTGETSEGIAEYSTGGVNPVAVLGSGPSILYPLWGVVGAHLGAEKINVQLTPSNAFVFVNTGTGANVSSAAWAPMPVSGTAVYALSPGSYTFQFLLSDYKPTTAFANGHYGSDNLRVRLKSDRSLGVYTPLWAEANSQLAAISYPGGAGTLRNPYFLFNQPATISTLFGELNDYLFPVFPGIYLIDTTDYVSAVNLPQFSVSYLLTQADNIRLLGFGVPLTDDLNIELYNASHVSIVDNSQLSGWFLYAASFADPASVYLWNSTNDLIAGNTFEVESNGITASGGGFNTIWGNTFAPTSVGAPESNDILNNGSTFGLNLWESNDLIYNNAFLTPITATLEPFNFYNGAFEPYTGDIWNVSLQSAHDVQRVNGWALSGNILGLRYEGGNYWSNYGTAADPYGVLPYNNGGFIYTGGDYLPLVPFPLHDVTFSEVGLTAGTTWSVTLNGYTQSSTSTTIMFLEPDGTYPFSVGPVTGYTATPSSGSVHVHGHSAHETISFS